MIGIQSTPRGRPISLKLALQPPPRPVRRHHGEGQRSVGGLRRVQQRPDVFGAALHESLLERRIHFEASLARGESEKGPEGQGLLSTRFFFFFFFLFFLREVYARCSTRSYIDDDETVCS